MHDIQRGGLPVRAVLRPAGMYLALRQIDPRELRDPFMQETVARLPAGETVVHIAREDVGLDTADTGPAGMIFHVARCGSTLISQLLKTHDDLVVYAEPLPVNEILLPPHKWARNELVAALRSLGAAICRHASRPYVLKFSSWNTLFCDIVTDAFPDSPWILALRDPIEVGVSLQNRPPGWIGETDEPSRRLSRFVDPAGASSTREEYIARVLGAFFDAASRLDARRGKLVDYESLPAAVWESVAPHFSISVDARHRSRMTEAARMYSKTPLGTRSEFARDIATKQAAASAGLRGAIDAFARPQLDRLGRLHSGTTERE